MHLEFLFLKEPGAADEDDGTKLPLLKSHLKAPPDYPPRWWSIAEIPETVGPGKASRSPDGGLCIILMGLASILEALGSR